MRNKCKSIVCHIVLTPLLYNETVQHRTNFLQSSEESDDVSSSLSSEVSSADGLRARMRLALSDSFPRTMGDTVECRWVSDDLTWLPDPPRCDWEPECGRLRPPLTNLKGGLWEKYKQKVKAKGKCIAQCIIIYNYNQISLENIFSEIQAHAFLC